MKKLTALLLALVMLMIVLPMGAFAFDEIGCEIYSVAYLNDRVSVDGRLFTHNRGGVTVTANPRSGSQTVINTTCDTSGRFTADFAGSMTAYTITVITDLGATKTIAVDFSGLSGLYETKTDYNIGTMFSAKGLSIVGTHAGADNAIVTMRVVDQNSDEQDLSMVRAMDDANSEGKYFSIDLHIPAGDYTMQLKAKGVEKASYNFTYPSFDRTVFANDESEFDTMVSRLNTYVSNLENKILECENENIPTGYEQAYLEIIKKYITYAQREVYYGQTYRMGNFLYALTRIYNQAMNNLDGYLGGTKSAYSTGEFQSGGITVDGTSVLAEVKIDDETVSRPTFLVGYGLWETVDEETEFLSSIGANFIQSGLAMQEVLTQIRGGGWLTETYKGEDATERCMAEIKSAIGVSQSGNYALKVNYKNLTNDSYRYVHQRFRVKPNTTYVYGLSAKAESIVKNAASFNIFERFTGMRHYLNDNVNSTDWKSYQFEYTTDAYTEWLDFTMMFGDLITDLYIDDVYVYEKGSTVNLLKNGTFDDYTSYPTSYDAEAESKGYYINHHTINNLHRILQKAERNNVAVDVILGPAPADFMYHSGNIPEAGTGFTTFPLDNATAREAISLFARTVAEELKSEPAAVSLCLINEPEVKAWYNGDYYKTAWENWLKTKYNNNTWSLYQAHGDWKFNEAKMPSGAPKATSSAKAKIKYNDYIAFNDSLLSEFHTWYAGEVKKVSDIPIHTKTMQYLKDNYQNYFIQGTNYDLVADALDVNGCDAWSEYADQSSLSAKMAWYDLMTSTADKPVWNTEDHVTGGGEVRDADGNVVQYMTYYNDLEPKFVASDLWNGAIHGRGASALWCWNDSRRTMTGWGGSIHSNTNVIHKPEQVAKTAEAMMDLNRLAEEVTAIQTAQAKVGILYSRTSVAYMHDQGEGFHNYTNPYMEAVLQTYDDVITSGQKAGFITDGVYDNMDQYELVIVPGATHVPVAVLNAIKAYQDNGGTVLILSSTNALTKTENNANQNSSILNAVKKAADTTSTVKGKIQAMGLSDVVLVDTSGNALTDVEWNYASYGDGYVVNVLNYNYDIDKQFKVLINGCEVGNFADMRSGKHSDNGLMFANTLEPMLLKVNNFTMDLVDQSGTVLSADIDQLVAGMIRCTTPLNGGSLILALYEDGNLVKASIARNTIEIPTITEGKEYRLMAAYWDMNTLTPFVKSKNIYQ